MHIAQFSNFYHPHVNGVVRSVSSFRSALTELGHAVFIFAQDAPDYEDSEPFIFRYPAFKLPLQFLELDIPAAIPISPFIDKLLPPLKLDVIHTHHPFLLGQVAATKSAELDLPLIFTYHTQYREYTHYFPIPQELVQEFLKETMEIWLGEFMSKCHQIIVPTESMREKVMHDYGIEARVTAIPTGIDLRPYEKVDGPSLRAEMGWQDQKIMISIGRIAKEKNFETLLNAAAQVMPDYPTFRLVLIGDGPDKENLRKRSRELGVADRVDFLGKVPFDDIPRYLKAADIFGFASITETQGLVTMEAMAAGLPVVAVDATGTSDVVTHEHDGLLTRNEAGDMARAIRMLMDDPELEQRLRDGAAKKIQTFESLTVARRLLDVYKEAIESKKQGSHVKVAPEYRLKRFTNLNLKKIILP